jgi:hypothetical protein
MSIDLRTKTLVEIRAILEQGRDCHPCDKSPYQLNTEFRSPLGWLLGANYRPELECRPLHRLVQDRELLVTPEQYMFILVVLAERGCP